MHRRIGEDDTSTVEPEQYIPLHTCIFHMESTTQLWEPTSSASPVPPHIPSDWIRDWEKMTAPSWNRTGIFPCPLPHFTQNVPQNRQFRFSIPITYSIQNASTYWRNDSSVLERERSSSEQPRTHLPEVLVCAVCSLQFCCLRMRVSCVPSNFLLNRLDVECEDLGNSLLNVSSEESVMRAVR